MLALDHIGIDVSDVGRSLPFYEDMLRFLGFEKIAEHDWGAGFVRERFGVWVTRARNPEAQRRTGDPGVQHLAFRVESRGRVDAFYREVVLKHRLQVEDPPVECPEYSPNYYATFFYDPDGLKLEVVYDG